MKREHIVGLGQFGVIGGVICGLGVMGSSGGWGGDHPMGVALTDMIYLNNKLDNTY